ARRLGRDRRLADPERPAQRRCRRDMGERAPRRRRRHRQLDPRRHGRRRRRDGRRGRAARAGAHDRSGDRRHATSRRGLSRGRGSSRSARPRRADVALSDRMSSTGGGSRLLIRDRVQLATPRGAGAPVRGPALGDVEVLEDAYVLCRDGTVEAIGRMRDLRAVDGEVEELDARGLCAVPGLVDCHTHACFAGDRVEEFAMRAGGATYEELHAAGGGIMATVNATRAAGETALADAVRTHRAWMLRAGTTTFESKSGYGLDRDTELASLRAILEAGGVPTWLGGHAVPPEFDDADSYLDFALAEVLPEAAPLAEAADVFLERGAFDAAQSRRYLEACAAAGLT